MYLAIQERARTFRSLGCLGSIGLLHCLAVQRHHALSDRYLWRDVVALSSGTSHCFSVLVFFAEHQPRDAFLRPRLVAWVRFSVLVCVATSSPHLSRRLDAAMLVQCGKASTNHREPPARAYWAALAHNVAVAVLWMCREDLHNLPGDRGRLRRPAQFLVFVLAERSSRFAGGQIQANDQGIDWATLVGEGCDTRGVRSPCGPSVGGAFLGLAFQVSAAQCVCNGCLVAVIGVDLDMILVTCWLRVWKDGCLA